MSQVIKGRELELFTGDGIRAIGCSSACTLTLTTNEIVTTSLGSGAATNREYGGYDWSVSSSGVLVIQDEFDGTGKLDPLEFAAYILQGIKVAVKFQITDEKYYFGTGIIKSASYQGQADNFALFTVEILADGDLTPTSNLVSPLTGTYSNIDMINVFVTGVSATGAIGTVVVVAEAIVYPTGVSATGFENKEHSAIFSSWLMMLLNIENAIINDAKSKAIH